jgi:hypothetical protein
MGIRCLVMCNDGLYNVSFHLYLSVLLKSYNLDDTLLTSNQGHFSVTL